MKHSTLNLGYREKINHIFHENGVNLKVKLDNSVILKSKKNFVIKVHDPTFAQQYYLDSPVFIVKYFTPTTHANKARWKNEVKYYKILSKIAKEKEIFTLPKILLKFPNVLLLSFLTGESFQSLLLAKNLNSDLIHSLMLFYSSIHEQKIGFNDNRLVNFHSHADGKLAVLDLEEMGDSPSKASDIASLLCSFIDLTPGIFQHANIDYEASKMCEFLREYIIYNYQKLPKEMIFVDLKRSVEFWVENMLSQLKVIAFRRKMTLSNENMGYFKSKLTTIFSENIHF